MACADLLYARQQDPSKYNDNQQSAQLVSRLEIEFAPELDVLAEKLENKELQLEEVYTRIGGIGGTPLRDGFHVGQTIWNDDGRPYGEGFNNVTGGISHGEYNMLSYELQGEYEYSAPMQAYSPQVASSLAKIDAVPQAVLPDFTEQNKIRLLDTYGGATFRGWMISAGSESLWWGPDQTTAMLYTNNVNPMFMINVDRTVPMHIPGVSRILGPIRIEAFMARMEGHEYPPSPWFHGEKFSFMPFKDFEIGFSRTTVWTGVGRPFSWTLLGKTYFSVGDQPKNSNSVTNDPGDRRGGLDFRWQLPGLRNLVTLYNDAFSDDDPNPLANPSRAAWNPGIYFSRLPYLPRLDLRLEGGFTELPANNDANDTNGHFFYWNTVYHDSYTQNGMMLGSLLGRDGTALSVASTYWFAADRTVQLSWIHHTLAPHFIPGAGRQDDFKAAATWALNQKVMFQGFVQYEYYKIPFLAASTQKDVAVGFQIEFWPKWGTKAPPVPTQPQWKSVNPAEPSFRDVNPDKSAAEPDFHDVPEEAPQTTTPPN